MPTTNEITLLSYSEMESESFERCERHPDGQFMCYLSVPILKEVSKGMQSSIQANKLCISNSEY